MKFMENKPTFPDNTMLTETSGSMDISSRLKKVINTLLITTYGGLITGIVIVFLTTMWNSVSSFSTQIQRAQVENQVRALSMEKIFIGRMSELELKIDKIQEMINLRTEFVTVPTVDIPDNSPSPEKITEIQNVLQQEILDEVKSRYQYEK